MLPRVCGASVFRLIQQVFEQPSEALVKREWRRDIFVEIERYGTPQLAGAHQEESSGLRLCAGQDKDRVEFVKLPDRLRLQRQSFVYFFDLAVQLRRSLKVKVCRSTVAFALQALYKRFAVTGQKFNDALDFFAVFLVRAAFETRGQTHAHL